MELEVGAGSPQLVKTSGGHGGGAGSAWQVQGAGEDTQKGWGDQMGGPAPVSMSPWAWLPTWLFPRLLQLASSFRRHLGLCRSIEMAQED